MPRPCASSLRAGIESASPEIRAQAESQLTRALRHLFAVAESYPELKASETFRELQSSLDEIEEALQNSRRYYNAVVRDLNTAIESFPSNLVATTFQFKKKGFFQLDRPGERGVPRVVLSS